MFWIEFLKVKMFQGREGKKWKWFSISFPFVFTVCLTNLVMFLPKVHLAFLFALHWYFSVILLWVHKIQKYFFSLLKACIEHYSAILCQRFFFKYIHKKKSFVILIDLVFDSKKIFKFNEKIKFAQITNNGKTIYWNIWILNDYISVIQL